MSGRTELIAVARDVLPGVTADVRRGASALRFAPQANGKPGGRLTVDDDWIQLWTMGTAPMSDAARLGRHVDFPGGVRYAARLRGRCAMLRAEVPVIGADATGRRWLAQQLGLVARGFGAALGAPRAAEPGQPVRIASFDPAALADLCARAGYPLIARSDDELRVKLESCTRAHRVAVISHDAGVIRARTDLTPVPLAPESVGDTALAHYLMRCSAALRFARPFLVEGADGLGVPGFDVTVAEPLSAGVLACALGALATAVDLGGREAELLAQAPCLAAQYLAINELAGADPVSRRRPGGRQPASNDGSRPMLDVAST